MRFTLFLALLATSIYSFGQTGSTTVKSSETLKSQKSTSTNNTETKVYTPERPAYHVKLSTSGNSGVTNAMTPEQEIERCESHLAALDQKEAHLRASNTDMSTPELTKWLNDANVTRQSLNQRIAELK